MNKIRIFEIEIASRAQRRWMVCIMYAAFALSGGYAQLRSPSDFLLVLLSGLCCCGIFRIAGRQTGILHLSDADERDLRIRDRALARAYLVVSGLAIFALTLAPLMHPSGSYWPRVLIFSIFTLPPSLIAWNEPESPTEGVE